MEMFIVPVLISVPFIILGVIFLGVALYYRLRGNPTKAKIIAIERYTQTYLSQSERHLPQVFYRPLYQYFFREQQVWIVGSGSANITHRIGSDVILQCLDRGASFCRPQKNVEFFFGFIFILFGLIPAGVAIHNGLAMRTLLASFLISLVALFAALIFLKYKNLLHVVVDGFLRQSTIETKESLVGREIFWDHAELKVEIVKHSRAALWVSTGLSVVSGVLAWIFWQRILPESRAEISACLADSCTQLNSQTLLNDPGIVGLALAGSFLSIGILSLVSSFISQIKK